MQERLTKTDIWLAWYPADYLKDTRHLICIEHGAYRQLLDAVFCAGGALSVTEGDIPRLCQLTIKEWSSMRSRIEAFFLIEKLDTCEVWRHKRISAEIHKAKEWAKLQQKRTAKARAMLQQKRSIVTKSVTDSVTKSVTGPPSPSPSPSRGGNGKPPSFELIRMEKELARVESRLKEVRMSGTETATGKSFTVDQRTELKSLKVRREELKRGLGFVA